MYRPGNSSKTPIMHNKDLSLIMDNKDLSLIVTECRLRGAFECIV